MTKTVPRGPSWITGELKRMIKRQHRLHSNFKRHGYRAEDKVRVDVFRKECNRVVLAAKEKYLCDLGDKLAIPTTGLKAYCEVINQLLNKCNALKIPPLLIDNKFVVNCKAKAVTYTNLFASQCKSLVNDSNLPNFLLPSANP